MHQHTPSASPSTPPSTPSSTPISNPDSAQPSDLRSGLTLHEYAPSGNCYKIRLVFAQLGIAYQRVAVDITAGETRTAAFLARNPQGKIPLLAWEDGRCLAESHAILWLFAQGSELLPTDSFEQARVLRWMCFEQYQLEPFVGGLRYRRISLGLTPKQIGADYARLRDGARTGLEILDRVLQQRSYVTGNDYSLADIALYAYTHQADELGFDWRDFPATAAWLARVRARPRHVGITD